jgi:histidinol-phosphate aminotransferase
VRITPRPAAAALSPYVPGRSAADEEGSLASNEPTFPVAPGVRNAVVKALAQLHRYPDPLARELCLRIAEELAVDPEQILMGNGSDELIYLLCLAYLPDGGVVVCADPPYRLHELVPPLMGGVVTRVPLREWVHDLHTMSTTPADFAFICNPHNPTGTVVSSRALEEFVETAPVGLIVVDEAYIDFADDPERLTVLHLARAGKIVLIRTMSKMFGLAGARLGYLVGPVELVDMLRRVRAPFSVNALGQAAGVAALGERLQHQRYRDHILSTRPRLRELFHDAGYQTVPSQANFVLVIAPDEAPLVARLWESGISVRPGTTLGIPGTVRVTIPSEAGLELLAHALARPSAGAIAAHTSTSPR